jgi:hypothetical protein
MAIIQDRTHPCDPFRMTSNDDASAHCQDEQLLFSHREASPSCPFLGGSDQQSILDQRRLSAGAVRC